MFTFKGESKFRENNRVTLLRDGDQFYPQLIRRIRQAKHEIFIETFILEDDRVGRVLRKALLQAVKRGVWVSVTADSYGTFYLADDYIYELSRAGVVFQIYDPQPRWFNARPKVFRRLHRKLVVIDNTYAFVGGINFAEDHITAHDDEGKRDFTAEISGPVVTDIRHLCASYVREMAPSYCKSGADEYVTPVPRHLTTHDDAKIAFISRDNRKNRSEIEKAYLVALRTAKKSVTIANAYFFPSYRVMRALRKATDRGVRVQLILQGKPDIPFALSAAQTLYDTLIRHKVEIYEYKERPLHAKIATIDDEWSSIGSSNLDPWSLALNLEANVFVQHAGFNRELTEQMNALIAKSHKVERESLSKRDWWAQLKNTFFYHFLRRLPGIVSLIPNPYPKVKQLRRIMNTAPGESTHRDQRREFPESRNARQVYVEKKSQTLGDVG